MAETVTAAEIDALEVHGEDTPPYRFTSPRLTQIGGWDGYFRLFKQQNGRCAICQQKPTGKKISGVLAIDHDHTTGEIRGLLCRACNHLLGNASDDTERLQAAIRYLQRTRLQQLRRAAARGLDKA